MCVSRQVTQRETRGSWQSGKRYFARFVLLRTDLLVIGHKIRSQQNCRYVDSGSYIPSIHHRTMTPVLPHRRSAHRLLGYSEAYESYVCFHCQLHSIRVTMQLYNMCYVIVVFFITFCWVSTFALFRQIYCMPHRLMSITAVHFPLIFLIIGI